MSKVKAVYSKIAPASKSQINIKNKVLENLLRDILEKVEKQQKENASFRKKLFDNDKKVQVRLQKIEEQQKVLCEQYKTFIDEQKQQNDLISRIMSMLEKEERLLIQNNEVSRKMYDVSEKMQEMLKKELTLAEKTSKATDEAIWGLTFNNAISDSFWLLNKTFYPGRWAVGYQYLYVLFRVLNEYRPMHILEMGLGQSTHMITQYTMKFEEVQHRVIEHDEKWISFFKEEHNLAERSEIIQLDLGKEEFLEDPEVTVYQRFQDEVGDKKYDFISVDAPFGGLAKIYARIDILKIIPDCLEDSFVIMVDDANRRGEQQTLRLIKEKLEESKIEYSSGIYKGNKETYIITSVDNKFLCTL